MSVTPESEGDAMKYFGTDGFRGRAGEGLTDDHAYRIGRFVGWWFGARLAKKARVVIGKDTRRSSYMLESALVTGLVSSGADAYLLHVIPTPGVCHEVADGAFDCGVMITASHNTFTDNGIKLIGADGHKMDDDVIELAEAYLDGDLAALGATPDAAGDLPRATGEAIGCTIDYMQGRNRYIAHLISSCGFSLQGMKVGLDCANGSASSVARPVFDALGAQTHVINDAPNGLNINVDCGSTHIDRLQAFVVRNGLDAGFAYDGDADRCIAVDERGHVIDGDLILYVCATWMAKNGRLAKNTVAATVMSNLGFLRALEAAGISCETTAVGDRHVYECMAEGGLSLGGEQSGHIIFSALERSGDGIMTSLRVMEAIMGAREKLSELVRPVTLYPQRLVNVEVAGDVDRDALIASDPVREAVSQAEELLAGDGRVLVRPSGTEPLIRVLAEAPTDKLCEEAARMVADAL